jgi:activator of HSP90 ATPase
MELQPDAEFDLFDKNVRGKIVSVEQLKKLVMTWQTKSPNWPSDHFGTMTMSLDQGSDSTKGEQFPLRLSLRDGPVLNSWLVTFQLEGVPAGQESDIERAIDTFYIRG